MSRHVMLRVIVTGAALLVAGCGNSDSSNSATSSTEPKASFADYANLTADGPTLLKLSTDKKALALGKTVFLTTCASCHGPKGQGMTNAPNMTDDHYLWVKKIADIPQIVRTGRNNGAMAPWEGKLTPTQILLVSAYMASLRGTNETGNPAWGPAIPAWADTVNDTSPPATERAPQ
ncbi:MAG: c-type cytochrome [Tepidisphaeraceae bacterium]